MIDIIMFFSNDSKVLCKLKSCVSLCSFPQSVCPVFFSVARSLVNKYVCLEDLEKIQILEYWSVITSPKNTMVPTNTGSLVSFVNKEQHR
jgi:hypothetical protein